MCTLSSERLARDLVPYARKMRRRRGDSFLPEPSMPRAVESRRADNAGSRRLTKVGSRRPSQPLQKERVSTQRAESRRSVRGLPECGRRASVELGTLFHQARCSLCAAAPCFSRSPSWHAAAEREFVMRKFLAITFTSLVVIIGASSFLSACNTVDGAGRDLKKVGSEVSEEANEHK